MGDRPTIYDVARAAGVSKSLVSLVLQGSPRVGADSRAAVEAAIRTLDYRPSRAAATLAAGRSRLIGVLIDDFANPWFVDLVRGIDHAVGPLGYRVTVVDTATAASPEDPVDGLLSMRTDGIVVARDLPSSLRAANGPAIVVAGTREQAPAGFDVIANDDRRGARFAAEHLLGLGHRSMAVLTAGGGAAIARHESFEVAARAGGARVVSSDYTGPATEPAGFDGALHLLRDRPDITAVFAANDVMAIGALGAARELGLDVPGRISIVGYDNTVLARTRLINLTTIDDNGFGVGREAGRLLAARLAPDTIRRSGSDSADVRRLLEPTLIVRGTTASPA